MGRKESEGKTEMRASTDLGFLSLKESHGKPRESFKQEACMIQLMAEDGDLDYGDGRSTLCRGRWGRRQTREGRHAGGQRLLQKREKEDRMCLGGRWLMERKAPMRHLERARGCSPWAGNPGAGRIQKQRVWGPGLCLGPVGADDH